MPEGNDWAHLSGVSFPRGVLARVGDLRPVSRHEVRWRCGGGPSGLCDAQQCHLPPLLTLSLSPLSLQGDRGERGPEEFRGPKRRPCK